MKFANMFPALFHYSSLFYYNLLNWPWHLPWHCPKWSILSSKMIFFFKFYCFDDVFTKITTSKMYYKSSFSIKEWCNIQLCCMLCCMLCCIYFSKHLTYMWFIFCKKQATSGTLTKLIKSFVSWLVIQCNYLCRALSQGYNAVIYCLVKL